MAKSIKNIALLALFAAAIIGSSAQTTYEVLDSLGWTIPPGGSVAYTAWAANKSFSVGDTLVFNYTTGQHDVAKVTKEAYDNCNATNPMSLETNGPTNMRLDSAGEHYFICTFSSHCNIGQKLAVNVTAGPGSAPAPAPGTPATPPPASAPAPATPSTPPPAAAPAPGTAAPTPAPSRAPLTYTVGDGLGWNVPPGGAAAYQTWASNKTFMVGDVLVFNFVNGTHNVAEVTKAAYDSCNTSSTISLLTNSPVRVTLNTAGEHYFTCTFPRHCTLGQQLTITVSGSSTGAPSPSPTTGASPPPSSTGGAPSPSTTTTPPPTPTTTPTPTTPSPTSSDIPPSGSSATSLRVTGLSATVLSVALALLY
ncbi:blue copper protein-like [Punica granatum]|uniref:Phytocyanin domain-containing protein n=2 Tax=Punica granatum TaxID=22663 RepID=A0A218W081_PUNGR|nr:blue copper protein-like [Punica granatum]OWM65929.1 hypothetical protein CDL15_Pgr015354 [Punica granatum]PKI79588.1 hypothetical protein CRG98_000063 [Punica granatum]